MCGLHCIIDFEHQTPLDAIKQMLEATRHRGLSEETHTQGFTKFYQFSLGHNLLPISSQNPVSQAFTDTEKRYFLLFNGEIYNWKKIDAKFSFSNTTQSDTETLFWYLVQVAENPSFWGELEGIFAFVFLDTQTHRLLTGRDKWGVKPLYGYQDEKKILFSSEMGAFWASGQVQKAIRKDAIAEYLTFKFPLRPNTFFENIFEHKTALQIWHLQSKTSESVHHLPAITTTKFEEAKVIVQTEKILLEVIEKQYSIHFPPALMLSGGIDSTLLLALAREQNLSLPAFSLITDQQKFTNDAYFAQKAAKLFQTPLEQIPVEASLLEKLPEILSKADYPIADTAIIPTLLIAQKAKNQNFRVLWSGAGADELFAGYNRHQAFAKYLSSPNKWVIIAKLLKNAPLLNRQISKFFHNIHPEAWQTFLNFASMEIKKPILNKFENQSLLQKALQWDKENYLFSDLLKINDFWAMQATLEVRVPYLDDTLTHYLEQIPADFLLQKGKKWILKEILVKRGGKIFAQRRKEGFGVPFGHWIRQNKYHHHFSFLKDAEHPIVEFLSLKQMNTIWHQHQTYKADFTAELFAIYFLAVWLEKQYF